MALTVPQLIETIEKDIQKSNKILKDNTAHETTLHYHDGKVTAYGRVLQYLRAMNK